MAARYMEEGDHSHEAGYDAFITGVVFLRVSHTHCPHLAWLGSWLTYLRGARVPGVLFPALLSW